MELSPPQRLHVLLHRLQAGPHPFLEVVHGPRARAPVVPLLQQLLDCAQVPLHVRLQRGVVDLGLHHADVTQLRRRDLLASPRLLQPLLQQSARLKLADQWGFVDSLPHFFCARDDLCRQVPNLADSLRLLPVSAAPGRQSSHGLLERGLVLPDPFRASSRPEPLRVRRCLLPPTAAAGCGGWGPARECAGSGFCCPRGCACE
mmetsp:Transcript_5575/g.13964  ORF Transcript_5575/g.13964 Transcript_5575/m.13964 type:complete len:203 (+) Transcript_5575:444-1052(+)